MALSIHSWHSIRLSAQEGVPAGAPSWAERRMECQEWTDEVIT